MVFADITGSAHDFSSHSWSGGETCIVCHTPHNADQTIVASPLWNHQVTSSVYELYSSATMDATMGQPAGVSRLCLSCHDGTVATDSYGGTEGTAFITGSANVGTDLSGNHPVGITWSHQTVEGCGTQCHDLSNGTFTYEVAFYDGKVECASCHDPHNNTVEPHMLRVTLAGSELCLYCHTDKS